MVTQAENSTSCMEVLMCTTSWKAAEGRGLSVPLVQLFTFGVTPRDNNLTSRQTFVQRLVSQCYCFMSRKKTVLIYPSFSLGG